MKIKNQLVRFKIGDREYNFANLILDNYINLFANSFVKFKNKNLNFCLVNFTKNNNITQSSTSMQYDVILLENTSLSTEYLSQSSIVNKYYYDDEYILSPKKMLDFEGQPIKEVGFAKYDEMSGQYILYAYLNVENYNLVPQSSQPIIITRIDKIESDMNLIVNNSTLKTPYHLSRDGILVGTEAVLVSELYSVGFGPTPNIITKEYLTNDLNISIEGGQINFNNDFQAYYNSGTLFAREDLWASNDLYAKKATETYLIYKFKIYREEGPLYEDTGMFYIQYKRLRKQGILNLNILYERS